jgi:hypothetical protein
MKARVPLNNSALEVRESWADDLRTIGSRGAQCRNESCARRPRHPEAPYGPGPGRGSKDQQTLEGLAALNKAEIERWWPVMKAAGLKPG